MLNLQLVHLIDLIYIRINNINKTIHSPDWIKKIICLNSHQQQVWVYATKLLRRQLRWLEAQLTRECWRDLRAVLLLVRVPDLLKGRLTAIFLSRWKDALLPPTGSLSLPILAPSPGRLEEIARKRRQRRARWDLAVAIIATSLVHQRNHEFQLTVGKTDHNDQDYDDHQMDNLVVAKWNLLSIPRPHCNQHCCTRPWGWGACRHPRRDDESKIAEKWKNVFDQNAPGSLQGCRRVLVRMPQGACKGAASRSSI